MKSRFLLAWLVVGVALTISRLAAQDVTVTDPAWFDPEDAPADQPPQFTKRPKPDFPDELKKPEQVAYAIVEEIIGDKGERRHKVPIPTNPYLERSLDTGGEKFSPAMRGGKAVVASCWYAVIFNPRSASATKVDATPRLLAVAPVVIQKKELSTGLKTPLIIWVTLNVDEKGQPGEFVFDESADERFREPTSASLRNWRFDPARRGGQAVKADLHVPLILNQPYKPIIPGTPPKVLARVQPLYPFVMKASGLRGEVLVEFTVDKAGAVKDPVIRQTNNPGFNEAAIDAMMKWKFEPGRSGGELANARMQQLFVFDMDSGGHDYAAVEKSSKQDQAKIPEHYRYDIAPKAKGVLTPVFPYPLLLNKVNGRASVAFLISPDGRVSGVKVLEATKPEFGLAMVAAVEAFSFIPAMKDGKPTKTVLRMEQKFIHSGYETIVTDAEHDLLALEKKHPEKILPPKRLDSPLKPVSVRSPVFPSSMQPRLAQGKALIEIVVDETGKVHLPRIVEATDPAFGYAAIQAVMDWRFELPKAGGNPVVVRARVPFEFTLAPSGDETLAADRRADEAEGRQH